MSYETIILTKENGIGTLTINRPKLLNTISSQVVADFAKVIPEIENDPEIRVLIVTGAGDQAFAAGADVKEFNSNTPESAVEGSTEGNRVYSMIANLKQPTIAMVNGFALGGGLELALACDVRLGADTAKVGLPEVGLGILPGYGGTQRLARLVGPGVAKEMIFTGRNVDAEEAYRVGIFNHVHPAKELVKETTKLAMIMAGMAPVSVQRAKKVVNAGLDGKIEEGIKLEAESFGALFKTEDRTEGISAFFEKRRPNFKGK